MESEWAMFCTAIVVLAAQSCGGKVAGSGRGCNPRTQCQAEEGDLKVNAWLLILPRQQTTAGCPYGGETKTQEGGAQDRISQMYHIPVSIISHLAHSTPLLQALKMQGYWWSQESLKL